jgi:hypothetical protein
MITKEQRRIYKQNWRKNHPDRFKYQKKKDLLSKRCRDKGLSFDLSCEDIKELRTGNCVYCGINNNVMTIDRKDNNIGYIKSNCVTACWYCNTTKGATLSYDEMLILGEAVKKIRVLNPKAWMYFPTNCSNYSNKGIVLISPHE